MMQAVIQCPACKERVAHNPGSATATIVPPHNCTGFPKPRGVPLCRPSGSASRLEAVLLRIEDKLDWLIERNWERR